MEFLGCIVIKCFSVVKGSYQLKPNNMTSIVFKWMLLPRMYVQVLHHSHGICHQLQWRYVIVVDNSLIVYHAGHSRYSQVSGHDLLLKPPHKVSFFQGNLVGNMEDFHFACSISIWQKNIPWLLTWYYSWSHGHSLNISVLVTHLTQRDKIASALWRLHTIQHWAILWPHLRKNLYCLPHREGQETWPHSQSALG